MRWAWRRTGKAEAPAAGTAGRERAPATEAALFEGVRQRRRPDFEALYRLYHPRLWRFLETLLSQPDLIEEALNDTMLVVWERAGQFEGRSRLSTWVFGIAYRRAMKALARSDRAEAVDEATLQGLPDPGPGPEEQWGLALMQRRLASALADLSPEHRAVVQLCYFQDMSLAEIAAVVACPEDTVKTRIFYARRRLRRLLEADGAAGPG